MHADHRGELRASLSHRPGPIGLSDPAWARSGDAITPEWLVYGDAW
jgi:hypothetical protein